MGASPAQYGSSETQTGLPNPSVALICAAPAYDAVKNVAVKKRIFIFFFLRYDDCQFQIFLHSIPCEVLKRILDMLSRRFYQGRCDLALLGPVNYLLHCSHKQWALNRTSMDCL